MRRNAFAWAVAVLGLALLAGSAFGEDLDARFRRVSFSFLAGWLVQHPERATLLGDHGQDARLPDLSVAGLTRRRAWLAAQRDTLRALPLSRLKPPDAVDARLMLHQVNLELRELNDERLAERDPRWALMQLRTAFAGHLLGSMGSPCTRAARLGQRMAKVPEFLRAVQLNLVAPSRACTELAIDDCGALIQMCREAPGEAFVECREPRFLADQAVADSQAVQALVDFRDFLIDDLLPGSTDAFPIDSAGLALRLGVTEGASLPLDSLLAKARAALAELPEVAVRDSVDAASTPLAAVTMNATLDSLRQRISAKGAFGSIEEERIAVRSRRPLAGSELPEVVAGPGPLETREPAVRLDLGAWPWRGAGALERDPRVDDSELILLLAREGVPGRGFYAMNQARLASRARQMCGWTANRDAWSRYAEEEVVKLGSGAQRDSLERSRIALQRERLARGIAELMLRVEGASLEQTGAWLERAAPLRPLEAHRAALLAAADPRWAASTLALDQLEELRKHVERSRGSRFRLDRLHDEFLKQGAVPVPWIEADVMRALSAGRKSP